MNTRNVPCHSVTYIHTFIIRFITISLVIPFLGDLFGYFMPDTCSNAIYIFFEVKEIQMKRTVLYLVMLQVVIFMFLLNGCGGGGDSGTLATTPSSTTITTPAPSSRFVDKGNGTLYDSTSNLTILKNANCFGALTWSNANMKSKELTNGQCSLSDGSTTGKWRLPTYKELSIMIADIKSPYGINYWSSTSCASFASGACYSLYNGSLPDFGYEFDSHYVWPVHSGQ
jgi:hypothetical protein